MILAVETCISNHLSRASHFTLHGYITKRKPNSGFWTRERQKPRPMRATMLSPAAKATIVHTHDKSSSSSSKFYGQFGIVCNRSCCFIPAHARSPSKLASSLDLRMSGPKRLQGLRMVFVTKAADSTQPTTSSIAKTVVTDDEFSLAKVSFGVIGLSVGISLLSYGFGAYFNILPGSEWSALMLTYGFPLAIIGMALKYAELKPVPCLTYSDAQSLRDTYATSILKQVKNDVTRYRYGDEQHLDEALKRIFQYGLAGGIPRRSAPILQMIREEVTEDGKYCLVLIFEAKDLQLSDFEKRQAKFTSFFGPNITAEVGKGKNDQYEVRLISNLTADSSTS